MKIVCKTCWSKMMIKNTYQWVCIIKCPSCGRKVVEHSELVLIK